MKKAISWLLMMILMLCSVSVFAEKESNEPEIASVSAILAQEGTGRIMYEKNADKKVYPASTTKVMTAMLAIEKLDPTQKLTASETAVQIDRDGSNMGVLAGEVLSVEQLLYGLLVHSANDAANVLAEAVAGSIPAFVELMNQRAAEIGMTNSHFMNAHGYHDPEHYTTARDMLTLCVKAMESDLFRQIVSTPQYEIPPTNKYFETRHLSSNNSLINVMKGHTYIYEGAKGIKTGHTSDAGYCLTSYAERKGLGYFCVTMHGEYVYPDNDSFIDTIKLFDYGFNGFALKNVADVNEIVATHDVKWARGGEQAVLSAKQPLEVLIPRQYDSELLTKEITVEETIKAPIKKGDILGKIEFFYDGVSVGSVELCATKNVRRSFLNMIFVTLWNLIFNVWVMTPLTLIVIVLLMRKAAENRRKQRAREKKRQEFMRELNR